MKHRLAILLLCALPGCISYDQACDDLTDSANQAISNACPQAETTTP